MSKSDGHLRMAMLTYIACDVTAYKLLNDSAPIRLSAKAKIGRDTADEGNFNALAHALAADSTCRLGSKLL